MPPGANWRGGGPRTATARNFDLQLGQKPKARELVKDRSHQYQMSRSDSDGLENAVIFLLTSQHRTSKYMKHSMFSIDGTVKVQVSDTGENTDLRSRIWNLEGESGKLHNLFGQQLYVDDSGRVLISEGDELSDVPEERQKWKFDNHIFSLPDERQLYSDKGVVKVAREGEENNLRPEQRSWTALINTYIAGKTVTENANGWQDRVWTLQADGSLVNSGHVITARDSVEVVPVAKLSDDKKTAWRYAVREPTGSAGFGRGIVSLPDGRQLYMTERDYKPPRLGFEGDGENTSLNRRTWKVVREEDAGVDEGKNAEVEAVKLEVHVDPEPPSEELCQSTVHFRRLTWKLDAFGTLTDDFGRQMYVDDNGWADACQDSSWVPEPLRRWRYRNGVVSLRDGRELYVNPTCKPGVAKRDKHTNTNPVRREFKIQVSEPESEETAKWFEEKPLDCGPGGCAIM